MIIDYSNADKIEELGTVWINGEEFKGIGYNGLLTVNTKTYVSEPTRANDGSMPNIGDHETFIVPRCKINFKYLNVNDYRRLCNAILPNEFLVKYYDKDFGDFVEHWMYCEPQEMAKIYNIGTAVIGVLDYEVSFIGTLNKLKELTVQYDTAGQTIKNLAEGEIFNSEVEYKYGDRVLYNGDYYEAIFYEDEFKGVLPPNANYWTPIVGNVGSWEPETRYFIGSLVSISTSGKTSYYECIKSNTGIPVDNQEYWKVVNVNEYDQNTTYTKGDVVYVYTSSEAIYYRASYSNNLFSGKFPYDTRYWKRLSILGEITINWGHSMILGDPMYLFTPPSGKTSADKWQVYIKAPNGEFVETSNYYAANRNVSILRDMKLKPVWE